MIVRRSPHFQSTSHTAQVQKAVLLENGEVPRVTQFATSVFAPNSKVESHVHEDMYESFFVQYGRIWVKVDGVEYEFCAGDSFTIFPNERHEMGNSASEEAALIYFGALA